MEKKLDGNYTRRQREILNKSLRQHPTKQRLYGHLPPITKTKLDEPDMQNSAREVRTSSQLTFSCGPFHMDEQKQYDQLEPTYNSSVPIQDITLKTYREQWTIETGGERASERSVLPARHDDDDDFLQCWTLKKNNHVEKVFLK